MRTYTLIGDRTRSDGTVLQGDYPATVAGMRSALNDGRRWLVIQEDLIEFNEPIDLDAVATGDYALRIDGGAVDGAASPNDGRTVFRKTASLTKAMLERFT